jgi:hypothetical protein
MSNHYKFQQWRILHACCLTKPKNEVIPYWLKAISNFKIYSKSVKRVIERIAIAWALKLLSF